VRVAPEELQAVHRAGALTRYAVFGPVAFVIVDLPATGIEGTGLDEPCLTEHHGIVTRGSFTVHHDDGRTERFDAGTAFYVPPGPPTHTFTSSARSVVCGFAPVPDEAPPAAATLADLGFEPVARPRPPVAPPSTVVLGGSVQPFRRPGAIDVEGSIMGPWLFMTARFGSRSGYTSGWCDLPHWGLVLDGEVVITFEGTTELASAGDAYYAPPGHRFASADGATIADYTPLDAAGAERVSRWRRAVLDVALGGSMEAMPQDGLDVEAAGLRFARRGSPAPSLSA
jgi:quercetin dioxygenase-like cupin family protein